MAEVLGVPIDDDRGQQVETCHAVVLALGGSIGDCQIFCALTRFLRHWVAFFEHDGKLALDRVPLSHRALPLL